MANRNHHKKLRAETLQLMARTGLSYQQARQQLLEREGLVMPERDPVRAREVSEAVDLLEATYFGIPVHIATAAGASTMEIIMVSREAGVTGTIRPLRGPVHRPPLRS